RVEMVLPRDRRAAVLAALVAAHPYEEPPYYVCVLAEPSGSTGHGRVGELPEPVPLAALAARLAERLPAVPPGVRMVGDPARLVRSVALHGGTGDDLRSEAARAGADVFVAGGFAPGAALAAREGEGPALVDAGTWAVVRPWLGAAAARLKRDLAGAVSVRVSDLVTDPWTVPG
ncbi:MAG TPA: Nif3-like dinuclear metal center hexameric protein, partial [Thermomonospora sp.]|nr:Nif3-like dinuclear metal center hexameric protein [Thermomonospora sp.]